VKMTKAQRIEKAMAALQADRTLTIKQVRAMTGLSTQMVCDLLSAMGIERRNATPAEDVTRITVLMEDPRLTAEQIAEQVGVAPVTVYRTWYRQHPNEKRDAVYFVKKLLAQNPNMRQKEMRERTGFCRNALFRARQKLALVKPQSPRRPIAKWAAEVATYPAEMSQRQVAKHIGCAQSVVKRAREYLRQEANNA